MRRTNPHISPKQYCALPTPQLLCHGTSMDEIFFEVREDEIDGGLVATALGHPSLAKSRYHVSLHL